MILEVVIILNKGVEMIVGICKMVVYLLNLRMVKIRVILGYIHIVSETRNFKGWFKRGIVNT